MSFDSPEFVEVICDVHNWMQEWIVAATHPYYAVTDAKGQVSLNDVPPGTYALELWHERLGTQSQSVVVGAGATTETVATFMMKCSGTLAPK